MYTRKIVNLLVIEYFLVHFFVNSLVFRAARVNHQRQKTFKDEHGEVVTRQVLVVCLHYEIIVSQQL